MTARETRVIGSFAYTSPERVVCTGPACVIAGSERAMRAYLRELDPGGKGHTVRKTRFGEIVQGLRLGAAYAFDAESYARFYPLARAEGLGVSVADFEAACQRGDKFFTVKLAVGRSGEPGSQLSDDDPGVPVDDYVAFRSTEDPSRRQKCDTTSQRGRWPPACACLPPACRVRDADRSPDGDR